MTTEHPSEQPRRHIGHALVHHAAGLVRNPDIQIIRDLIYLAFGQFGAKFAAFLLYAYLARVLAPRDYGALETMLAILAFAALVVDFGLGCCGGAAPGAEGSGPGSGDRRRARAAPAAGAALHSRRLDRGAVSSPTIPSSARLAGCLSLSLLLQAWRQEWLLQSLELMRLVALGQFLRVAVQAGVAILLIRGAADLAWFGLAEIAAAATMAVFYVAVQIRAGFLPGLSLERSVAGPLLRQALPLGLTAAIWGIVQNLPTHSGRRPCRAGTGGLSGGGTAPDHLAAIAVPHLSFQHVCRAEPPLPPGHRAVAKAVAGLDAGGGLGLHRPGGDLRGPVRRHPAAGLRAGLRRPRPRCWRS